MLPDRATKLRYRIFLYGGALALASLYIAVPATQWRVALSASVLYAAVLMTWARSFLRPVGAPDWYHPPRQSRSFAASLVFAALALFGIWAFHARGATLVFLYFPAVFILSLMVDVVALRHGFQVERSREEVERFLRAVAEGTAGPNDWSLFVFQPIADRALEDIRLRLLNAERNGVPRADAARQVLEAPAKAPPGPRGHWSGPPAVSERQRLAIAILVAATLVATRSPSGALHLTSFLAVGVAVSFGVGLLVFRWRHRRNLRFLLGMEPERHAEVIRHFPHPGYRARLERDLARDRQSYVAGVVEAFGFAESLKREASAQYWLVACAVAAAFLLSQRLPLATWVRTSVLIATAVVGFGGLQFLMRWRRYLDTWLEVSRFGLAEVWPDGSRRQIPWHQRLWLQNQPGRRRLRLLIADRSAGIPIHYRRTNFSRAMQLVIEYGGFMPPPQAAPPPAAPTAPSQGTS